MTQTPAPSPASTPDDDGIHLSVERLIDLRNDVALSGTVDRQVSGLTELAGQSRGRRHGSGVDFEDLRLYQPGDDVRQIDWNATARLGETYLKRYREERERLCLVIVDLRLSMVFGTQARLKSVAAGELAAAVCWLAAGRAYRVGSIVATTDSVEATRPAAAAQGALEAVGLIARQHEQLLKDWHGRKTDVDSGLDSAMQIAAHSLRKGGRAIVVTGGADPGSGFDTFAEQYSAQQQLLVYYLQDPLEDPDHTIPAGHYPWRTSNGSGSFAVSPGRTDSIGRRRRDNTAAVVQRYGVHHTPVVRSSSNCSVHDSLKPLLGHDFL